MASDKQRRGGDCSTGTATVAAAAASDRLLRCSVCGEIFKERHHLTRHMTAHQDTLEEAIKARQQQQQQDQFRHQGAGGAGGSIFNLL